jgi:hypothetical protein
MQMHQQRLLLLALLDSCAFNHVHFICCQCGHSCGSAGVISVASRVTRLDNRILE